MTEPSDLCLAGVVPCKRHGDVGVSNGPSVLDDLVSELDATCGSPAEVAQNLTQAGEYLSSVELALATGNNFILPSSEESGRTLAGQTAVLQERLGIDEVLVPILDRYDKYFGTRRVVQLTPTQLAYQTAQSARQVLLDARSAVLELNEIRSLVDSVSAALVSLLGSTSHGGTATANEEANRPVDLNHVALRRWKIGHHLFNCLAATATMEIDRATSCDNLNLSVESINLTSRIFRGTTAAMWYAEGVPRNLYASLIRPSMVVASGRGSGFSGTDNLEFRWFKSAYTRWLNSLDSSFGAKSTWTDEVLLAVSGLLETRHLDLEHHTLLAEKVVGRQPSLKLLRAMEAVDDHNPLDDPPAIDVLRDLAQKIVLDKRNLR